MLHYLYHPLTSLAFLALVIFVRHETKIGALMSVLLIGLHFAFMFLFISWVDFLSLYSRYVWMLLLGVTVFIAFRKLRYLPIVQPKKIIFWVSLGLKCILSIFFLSHLISILNSRTSPLNTIALQFPLKRGTYVITEGGNSALTNYHALIQDEFDEQYAIDIEKINSLGMAWHGSITAPKSKELFNIYGDTVFSPCNGVIVEAVNDKPDHDAGQKISNEQGSANRIEIQCGKTRIMIGHFLYHSLLIKRNDSVRVGQPLGLIGNSGKSGGPHLHIHAYFNNNTLNNGVGITFDGKFLIRNQTIRN